jgi:hypothetical protein
MFELASSIFHKCAKVISTVFDITSCYILAIKLKHGECQQIVSEMESKLKTSEL